MNKDSLIKEIKLALERDKFLPDWAKEKLLKRLSELDDPQLSRVLHELIAADARRAELIELEARQMRDLNIKYKIENDAKIAKMATRSN